MILWDRTIDSLRCQLTRISAFDSPCHQLATWKLVFLLNAFASDCALHFNTDRHRLEVRKATPSCCLSSVGWLMILVFSSSLTWHGPTASVPLGILFRCWTWKVHFSRLPATPPGRRPFVWLGQHVVCLKYYTHIYVHTYIYASGDVNSWGATRLILTFSDSFFIAGAGCEAGAFLLVVDLFRLLLFPKRKKSAVCLGF